MTRKAGTICMVLGTALILAALSLFLWNRWEDDRAGAAADYSRQESGAAALQLQEEDRGRAAGPEELDRAFRRDARRYDGGSFLY